MGGVSGREGGGNACCDAIKCLHSKRFFLFLHHIEKEDMTQVVLSIPNSEVPFLSSLAEKMGWNMQTA